MIDDRSSDGWVKQQSKHLLASERVEASVGTEGIGKSPFESSPLARNHRRKVRSNGSEVSILTTIIIGRIKGI